MTLQLKKYFTNRQQENCHQLNHMEQEMEEIIRNTSILVMTLASFYFLVKKPNIRFQQKLWEKFLTTFLLTFAITNLFNIIFENDVVQGQEHIRTITYFLMAVFVVIQCAKVFKYNRTNKIESEDN